MDELESKQVGGEELHCVIFTPATNILHATDLMQTLIARKIKIKLAAFAAAQVGGKTGPRSRPQRSKTEIITLPQLIRRLCNKTSARGAKPSMQWHATWTCRKQTFRAIWLAQQPSPTTPGLLVSITQKRIDEMINLADESKSQLQAIIETAVDGIITINENGLIETFNPAAEKLFGYRASAILGKPVSMLMPEPYRSEHAHYVNR